jgi:lantibiotic modifying enzyme
MGEEDLARQSFFLPRQERNLAQEPNALPLAHYGDRLVALARRAARQIEAAGSAIPEKDVAGAALFLAYLGRLPGGSRWAAQARRLAMIMTDANANCLGSFEGLGGRTHALMHLATLWGDDDLLNHAVRLHATVTREAARLDASFIDGAAGCLMVGLGLYRCDSRLEILTGVQRYAERLRELGTPRGEDGDGGFGRGSLGTHWAVARLCRVAPHYRDFRDTLLPKSFPLRHRSDAGWSNGLSGAILYDLLSQRSDHNCAAKLDLLLDMPPRDHTLGNGALGITECLLRGADTQDDAIWPEVLSRFVSRLAGELETARFECSGYGTLDGLAGIGYQLLRLADPEGVPSVLTLDPPKLKG